MKQAVVLGCGMVGATIARDLAGDPGFRVTAADAQAASLELLADEKICKIQADLSASDRICGLIADADVVVGALPSHLGFAALKTVIECGRSYCDISFMAEDARRYDALARERGVTAVTDCGVAPGLANMLIGRAHAELEKTDEVLFYVGGLPRARRWPYEYKAPFAPADVLEEYTRPARVVENGRVVSKPALSDSELIDFPHVGTLEACNTDGLRSLLDTITADRMSEKTLRYPGHFELMRVLRETGFFDTREIDVKGTKIRPRDLTARLLFPMWKRAADEPEFTALRVIVSGTQGGRSVRITYDLFDEFDAATRTSSMARTTGFPAAIVARLLANGTFRRPGVHPPEAIGQDATLLGHVLSELSSRGVKIKRSFETAE